MINIVVILFLQAGTIPGVLPSHYQKHISDWSSRTTPLAKFSSFSGTFDGENHHNNRNKFEFSSKDVSSSVSNSSPFSTDLSLRYRRLTPPPKLQNSNLQKYLYRQGEVTSSLQELDESFIRSLSAASSSSVASSLSKRKPIFRQTLPPTGEYSAGFINWRNGDKNIDYYDGSTDQRQQNAFPEYQPFTSKFTSPGTGSGFTGKGNDDDEVVTSFYAEPAPVAPLSKSTLRKEAAYLREVSNFHPETLQDVVVESLPTEPPAKYIFRKPKIPSLIHATEAAAPISEPVMERGFIPSFGPPTRHPFNQELIKKHILRANKDLAKLTIFPTGSLPVLRPEFLTSEKNIIPDEPIDEVIKPVSHLPQIFGEESEESNDNCISAANHGKQLQTVKIKPEGKTSGKVSSTSLPRKTLVYVLSESGGTRPPMKLSPKTVKLKPSPSQAIMLQYADSKIKCPPGVFVNEPQAHDEMEKIRNLIERDVNLLRKNSKVEPFATSSNLSIVTLGDLGVNRQEASSRISNAFYYPPQDYCTTTLYTVYPSVPRNLNDLIYYNPTGTEKSEILLPRPTGSPRIINLGSVSPIRSFLPTHLPNLAKESPVHSSSMPNLYTVTPPPLNQLNLFKQNMHEDNLIRNTRNFDAHPAPAYVPTTAALDHLSSVYTHTSPADFLASLLGDSYKYGIEDKDKTPSPPPPPPLPRSVHLHTTKTTTTAAPQVFFRMATATTPAPFVRSTTPSPYAEDYRIVTLVPTNHNDQYISNPLLKYSLGHERNANANLIKVNNIIENTPITVGGGGGTNTAQYMLPVISANPQVPRNVRITPTAPMYLSFTVTPAPKLVFPIILKYGNMERENNTVNNKQSTPPTLPTLPTILKFYSNESKSVSSSASASEEEFDEDEGELSDLDEENYGFIGKNEEFPDLEEENYGFIPKNESLKEQFSTVSANHSNNRTTKPVPKPIPQQNKSRRRVNPALVKPGKRLRKVRKPHKRTQILNRGNHTHTA